MVEMYRFDFLHGWGTAALLAFFTYIYEIWYTCVSYEDLQKSLLGPWSKPNRKSDIWNLVAFFLRLTCSIMLSLLRHFFSTWHRKSDEILMFFRLLYFQYCDNFVCGPEKWQKIVKHIDQQPKMTSFKCLIRPQLNNIQLNSIQYSFWEAGIREFTRPNASINRITDRLILAMQ